MGNLKIIGVMRYVPLLEILPGAQAVHLVTRGGKHTVQAYVQVRKRLRGEEHHVVVVHPK